MQRETLLTYPLVAYASALLVSCALDFDRFEPTSEAAGDSGAPGARDATVSTDSGLAALDGGKRDSGPTPDAAPEADAGPDALDASADSATPDADAAPVTDAGSDADAGPDLDAGLVLYYKFDETSGTTAADSSGNGRNATLQGGPTFTSGLSNNALTLSGSNQFATLPNGIVNGLASFSLSAWVKLNDSRQWARLFDFGSSPSSYMMLAPVSGSNTCRFAITTSGLSGEQAISGPPLSTGTWQHVAITTTAGLGVLYINGSEAGRNSAMTLTPASLGNTLQNWIARSEYPPDPYPNGQIDNFRIYSRTLDATEIGALFTQRR